MTEIVEICKNLTSDKQKSPIDERRINKCNIRIRAKTQISNSKQDGRNIIDNIDRSILSIIPEKDQPQMKPIIASCQTEPLDLSKKPDNIINKNREKSLPKRMWKPKSFVFETFFANYIKRFTANDVCNARCQMLYKDHYHCFAENGCCTDVMKGKDKLRQHGKLHTIAEELTQLEFSFCVSCSVTESKRHYHCSYVNCDFISTEISNMDRLMHVESKHCIIISKRANSQDIVPTKPCLTKRRRRTQDGATLDNKTRQLSQISNLVNDNPFMDFDPDSIINTINRNCINILAHLSSDRSRTSEDAESEEIDEALMRKINEADNNFFQNGDCSRLFCNLKKSDHYHCPICERGSSKKDLYIRHLKQRHK